MKRLFVVLALLLAITFHAAIPPAAQKEIDPLVQPDQFTAALAKVAVPAQGSSGSSGFSGLSERMNRLNCCHEELDCR